MYQKKCNAKVFTIEHDNIIPQDQMTFVDYLVTTYIDENACFPPTLWTQHSISMDHTTNSCENFHSKFNKSSYSSHPFLYNFLDVLKDMQTQ